MHDEYPKLVGRNGLGPDIRPYYLISLIESIDEVPTCNKNEEEIKELMKIGISLVLSERKEPYDDYLDIVGQIIESSENLTPRFLIKLGFTIEKHCEKKRQEVKERFHDDERAFGTLIKMKILDKLDI